MDNNLPAIWSEGLGTGYENERDRGPSVPRLSIAQPLSPEMIDGEEKYIEGLKNGDWFVSNGEKSKIIGKNAKLIFLHSVDRITKWKYKDQNHKKQVFVDQLTVEQFDSLGIVKDGLGKYTETTEDGSTFLYTRSKNFFVLNLDAPEDGILLLSLKGTNFFPGICMIKKFKSKIGPNGQRLPMFAYMWQLSTKRYDNDNGFHYGIGKDDEELLLTEIGPVTQAMVNTITVARQQVDHVLNNTVAEPVPF